MIIKPIVNIHCEDNYYTRGIYALVNKIIGENPFRLMANFTLPEFWVFSEGSMTQLLPFARSYKKGSSYIVFCNQSCQRVLENIPGLNIVCFIRIDTCCINAETILRDNLKAFVSEQHSKEQPELETEMLTPPQKRVIELIAKGYQPRQISELCEMSIKGVSFHKRDAMRRLGVTNNQELIIKSLMLRETELTD